MAKAAKSAEKGIEVVDDALMQGAMDFVSLSPALESVYAELGVDPETEANVYISRILEDGRESPIWKGPPEDYDLIATARKYGSGEYRVKLYVKAESGRFVLKANRVFPVVLEAAEDGRLKAIREGKIEATQTGAVQSQTITAADVARIVADALKANAPAPVNQLGMMREVAEIVRTLAPQPVASAAPAFNPIEMFRIFADIARERGDDDPPRGQTTGMDVFYRLVDRFAPALVQALGQPGAVALPPPTSGEGTATTATTQAQPQPAGQPQATEAMNKLRMGLDFLLMQAHAKNDPVTYADMILDNIPEEDLRAFLAMPDPIAYLATINTGVKSTPEIAKWFTDLLAEVRSQLEEQPEEPGDTLAPPVKVP